jgi:hypothetical protein
MTKLKQKKDAETKAKEKKVRQARKEKKAKAAAAKAEAGKKEAPSPKAATVKKENAVTVKKEHTEEEGDPFDGNNSNANNKPAAPKANPKPAAKAAPKVMSGSAKWRARNECTVRRVGDSELSRGVGPLVDFINRHSSSNYNQVPLLNILAFDEKPDKYDMYVLLFVWEQGQRANMRFVRCKVQQMSVAHPDSNPDDEPFAVTADISARNVNNRLVMVKNVDDFGVITRRPFEGQTVSVLLVSPDLIFCVDKTPGTA